MGEVIVVFCTTDRPTQDLIYEFNESCGLEKRVRQVNCFSPARHDPHQIPRMAEERINLTPDSFAGKSDAQLRDWFHGIVAEPDMDYVNKEQFAVLDPRGVGDHTVVLHFWHVPLLRPEMDAEDATIEPDGNMNPRWLSWRIPWKNAFGMSANLELSAGVLYDLYMKSDKWTDESGIYDVERSFSRYH